MSWSSKVADVVLAVGATARATRMVVADAVPGRWLIKDPIDEAMARYEARHVWWVMQWGGPLHPHEGYPDIPEGHEGCRMHHVDPEPWWWKYRSGLDCGFCISVHVSYLVLGSYYIARALGPKPLAAWRFGAATLAVSYVAGHTWARLDKDPDDD